MSNGIRSLGTERPSGALPGYKPHRETAYVHCIISTYAFPAYAPSRIVIPSELRRDKQRLTYPADLDRIRPALRVTTKFRGDDGGGRMCRNTHLLSLPCTELCGNDFRCTAGMAKNSMGAKSKLPLKSYLWRLVTAATALEISV